MLKDYRAYFQDFLNTAFIVLGRKRDCVKFPGRHVRVRAAKFVPSERAPRELEPYRIDWDTCGNVPRVWIGTDNETLAKMVNAQWPTKHRPYRLAIENVIDTLGSWFASKQLRPVSLPSAILFYSMVSKD